jgi:predicted N-acetyltransferase YhbS
MNRWRVSYAVTSRALRNTLRPMEYRPYERRDLEGIITLHEAEEWPSFPADAARAHRVVTNPGVTAYVATDENQVVGFVYLLSDGELQAYIANLVVAGTHRRQGIGIRLIQAAFAACGAERADLLSEADAFYDRLIHRKMTGFRLYPPFAPPKSV